MLAKNKKITVQIATRGRSSRLPSLVDNIYNTSSNRNNVEVIFYVDDDDPTSLSVVNSLDAKVVCGPRGIGYWDGARFHTEMAKISSGELLMLGNDDMEILTQGWDDILYNKSLEYPDHVFVLKTWDTHNPRVIPFPTIHSYIVELMGCFTPIHIGWIDHFLSDVMTRLNRYVHVDEVKTTHHRMYDNISEENRNTERKEWHPSKRTMIHNSEMNEWISILQKEINK